MPRAGLSHQRVVAEAAAVADEFGLEQLTLAAVADRLVSPCRASTNTSTGWRR